MSVVTFQLLVEQAGVCSALLNHLTALPQRDKACHHDCSHHIREELQLPAYFSNSLVYYIFATNVCILYLNGL